LDLYAQLALAQYGCDIKSIQWLINRPKLDHLVKYHIINITHNRNVILDLMKKHELNDVTKKLAAVKGTDACRNLLLKEQNISEQLLYKIALYGNHYHYQEILKRKFVPEYVLSHIVIYGSSENIHFILDNPLNCVLHRRISHDLKFVIATCGYTSIILRLLDFKLNRKTLRYIKNNYIDERIINKLKQKKTPKGFE